MNLYTAGYEGINIDQFVDLLNNNDTEALIDIRDNPNSRKPGFSRKALAEILNEHGIEYAPFYALGTPRNIRKSYREDNDWDTFSKKYLEYLDGQADEVTHLAQKAENQRCCLLCFEADYTKCHRLYVAAAVKEAAAYPLEIVHLSAPAKSK